MSQILCAQCQNGSLIYPSGEKKLQISWQCNECSYEMDASKVKELTQKSQNDLKTVVAMKNGGLTNELALKRMESFLAENKHLGPYHYLKLICIRNWMTLNKSGDFFGQDRLQFSQNLLKIVQKCGGQYSDWSGFIFKDMAFTSLQRLSQVPKEKHALHLTMAKAFSKQAQLCKEVSGD